MKHTIVRDLEREELGFCRGCFGCSFPCGKSAVFEHVKVVWEEKQNVLLYFKNWRQGAGS